MQKIDFLPEEIRMRRARQRRWLRYAYVIAVCVLGLGGLGYVRQGNISEAQAELRTLKNRAGNLRRELETRRGLERQMADLMIKKRINDQLGCQADTMDVLAELDRLLPQGMALRKLNLEVVELRETIRPSRPSGAPGRAMTADGGSKPRVIRTKRMRLVLTGLAPTDVDVANFIGQLSASPLFEDVNMGYAKTVSVEGLTAREFQASCYVVR